MTSSYQIWLRYGCFLRGRGAPRHVLKLLLVAFARTLGRSGQIEVPALHGRVLNRN